MAASTRRTNTAPSSCSPTWRKTSCPPIRWRRSARPSISSSTRRTSTCSTSRRQPSTSRRPATSKPASLRRPARSCTWSTNGTRSGLGARLLPFLDRWGQEAALSPVSSPAPRAPVFVMHAQGDDVIPDSEATALGDYLRSQGTPVRVHVTSLMSHAEVARAPTPGELVTMRQAGRNCLGERARLEAPPRTTRRATERRSPARRARPASGRRRRARQIQSAVERSRARRSRRSLVEARARVSGTRAAATHGSGERRFQRRRSMPGLW